MVKKILPPGAREDQDYFMEALKEPDMTPFLFEQFLLEEKDINEGINNRDKYGRTKLAYVSQFQTEGYMVDGLAKHGADINAADDNKDTPLHHEADSDLLTEDKLAAYLNNGANPLARNKQGLIPLQLAQQHAHKHNKGAIRMLKEATQKAEQKEKNKIAAAVIRYLDTCATRPLVNKADEYAAYRQSLKEIYDEQHGKARPQKKAKHRSFWSRLFGREDKS